MNDFRQFIKAVATGPKGNRDLTFEESKRAMDNSKWRSAS